jgi:DNA modification methylase
MIKKYKHRILAGDCTIKENVDKLMNGEKADMVFTDPPYGVSYSQKNVFLNTICFGNRLEKDIENDSKTVPEMFELWCKVFNMTAEFCTDKSNYYICSPQRGELMMMMMQAIDQSPWSLKHTLIWNKNNHVLGRCDYHYKHEPILYGWKKKGTHNFYGNGTQTKSVWDIAKPHNSDLHPTMKPIELMENALLNSSIKENKILDIFLGSGSTLIACEKTNRKCFGMEIDPQYVDVIIERWCKYTGINKIKLNDQNIEWQLRDEKEKSNEIKS